MATEAGNGKVWFEAPLLARGKSEWWTAIEHGPTPGVETTELAGMLLASSRSLKRQLL